MVLVRAGRPPSADPDRVDPESSEQVAESTRQRRSSLDDERLSTLDDRDPTCGLCHPSLLRSGRSV